MPEDIKQRTRLAQFAPAFIIHGGAWLNSAGEVELDAIIMEGATLHNGAVAAVQHVHNPISLARLVMERTPQGRQLP